jgi:F-type H+-transporting ATPase subunit c
VSPESVIIAVIILGFSLIIAAAAVGSAIGDGIVASKAVEAIARQPEARPNIFLFMFLGIGILEVFPLIGLGLAVYLFFVVAPVQQVTATMLKSVIGH